jgi:hypothetical protein
MLSVVDALLVALAILAFLVVVRIIEVLSAVGIHIGGIVGRAVNTGSEEGMEGRVL